MRFTRKLAGPLLAVLMAAGATAATAMPASAATVAPYFRIGVAPQGSSFLRCLQGNLGGPLGSAVTQQPCNPDLTDASQLWLPLALGGDIYKFENVGTGRCLEARNGAVNGGAVDLWPCESGESNERWYWPPSATPGGSPGRSRSRHESPAVPGSASTSRGRRSRPGFSCRPGAATARLPSNSGSSSSSRPAGRTRGQRWRPVSPR
jgi:hypothetical protein